MRFFDILKVSLHNMWNNKTRTALVTLVLFVLSTLVTVLLAFGINFLGFITVGFSTDDPIDITIEYMYTGENRQYISYDQVDTYKKEFLGEDNNIFTSVTYDIDYMDMYSIGQCKVIDVESNPYVGSDNFLIEGRLWNKSDIEKNYIWVDDKYALENNIAVGDTITIEIINRNDSLYPGMSDDSGSRIYDYKVMGVVKNYDRWSSQGYIYVGYDNIKKMNVKITRMQFVGSKLVDNDVLAEIMTVRDMTKQHNEFDQKTNQSGIYVHSSKVDNMMMAIYISLGVMGGLLIISLIVILMSIGCVSNSIQITVEQNRKFFGMMKAIGLRNNTVKSIVRWQAAIMIIIAVLLAALVTTGIIFLVEPIVMNNLAPLMFGTTGVNVSFTMPFYVPFIVLFMLLGLVMLFTIKSLNKISKMDVVSVISEVN